MLPTREAGAGKEGPGEARAGGAAGWGGSSPHLLELVHSLLQLHPHSVLLFPPGRHGGQGGSLGAGSCPGGSPLLTPPLRPLSHSSSGARGAQGPWARPGRPVGGQLQLSGGSTLPGKCKPACCLPGNPGPRPRNRVRLTAATLLPRSARPARALAQPAARLASSPLGPAPDPQATFRGTDPVSRLLPAPAQGSSRGAVSP